MARMSPSSGTARSSSSASFVPSSMSSPLEVGTDAAAAVGCTELNAAYAPAVTLPALGAGTGMGRVAARTGGVGAGAATTAAFSAGITRAAFARAAFANVCTRLRRWLVRFGSAGSGSSVVATPPPLGHIQSRDGGAGFTPPLARSPPAGGGSGVVWAWNLSLYQGWGVRVGWSGALACGLWGTAFRGSGTPG